MTNSRRKVVVVGGGITGLTAAYTLQQKAAQSNLPIDVILIESSLRIGGKIDTIRKDGFVIERGPESFFDLKNDVRNLARELNIEHEMIQHNDGKTYIAVGNEMHNIPSSFLLGGSSELTGLMTSSLISLSGKIRAAGDLFIGKTSEHYDEPIGSFFKRRFGKEVVENLIEPVLAGTFAGDIDHLSMEAMFPQYKYLEMAERSLIKGLLKNRQGFYNSSPTSENLCYETFKGGLSTLVETLEVALLPGTIRKGMKVDSVERLRDKKLKMYINNGSTLEVDGVIITTPFNQAKSILRDSSAVRMAEPMKAATIGTVTMAFKVDEIKKYKQANQIFVSRKSSYSITSCTFANRKWLGVSPDGYELLRIYIGRVGDESIVELSDYEITQTVLSDLEKMLSIKAVPLFSIVGRWQQGMPQYTVGHKSRTQLLKEEVVKSFPNVLLAGSSFNGVSMPNCIKQGRNAALEILNQLHG